jgi:hypothetical protein
MAAIAMNLPLSRTTFAAALPAVSRTAELVTAEAFVIVSMRLWAAPYRWSDEPYADWRLGFAAAGVDEAERAFDELFRLVRFSGTRPVEVRCPRCGTLAGDEIALLRIVAQLQRCRWFEAEAVLSDWLPPHFVNAALASTMMFATALAGAGLVLPLRAWSRPTIDFAALASTQVH